MGRIKEVARTLGKVADAYMERQDRIDAMHREIMKRSSGVDPIEARKIAATLVDRAEVTWK